jgi:hypothetical protein
MSLLNRRITRNSFELAQDSKWWPGGIGLVVSGKDSDLDAGNASATS